MWGISFASIIPPMVNAVQIQVMNAFYGTVAIKLTDLVRPCVGGGGRGGGGGGGGVFDSAQGRLDVCVRL